MPKLVYLACPYTSTDPVQQNDRVEAADYYAAELMRQHHLVVFSPISHGHRIGQHLPLPLLASHSFWMKQCTQVLRRCDELVLLPLPGWQESKGVTFELSLAQDALEIPVSVIQAKAFNPQEFSAEELFARRWKEIAL